MAKVFFTLSGERISIEDVQEFEFDTDIDIATGDECAWYVFVDGIKKEIDSDTFNALKKM